MEVPGKREINNFSCKPCEESDVLTQADGFCTNCEEYMCSSCFNTHKKYKLNRDHTLMDCNEEITQRESSSNFEKCEQHLNESVKFYCAQHEQVGCGDCMVIGHRSCKVDYILDKANDLKGTTELESLVKGPEICTTEAKRLLSSIKDNKVQIDDINIKFKQEVNQFWEEITTQINNLKDRMLKEGECIKERDSLSMTKLEGETESLTNDLSVISDLFESRVQNPSQLFVCSVSQKPKLDRLMKQLNDIKSRNKIEPYKFIKDSKITSTLATLGQLGMLQEDKDLYDQEEITEQGVSKPLKTFEDTAKRFVLETLDQEDVVVTCDRDDFNEISKEEYELLISVPTCADRDQIFLNKEWMQEGQKLKVGDYVEVYNKASTKYIIGILRYRGHVQGVSGILFGVELVYNKGQGHSDGVFRNKRYFTCSSESAIFVCIHRIRQHKGLPPPQRQSEPARACGTSVYSQYKINAYGIKMGDRIVWISDDGPEAGVVKWIGLLPDCSDDDDIIVGVEFDNPVGSGTGVYRDKRLFTAKQKHAGLVPILGLLKEEERK